MSEALDLITKIDLVLIELKVYRTKLERLGQELEALQQLMNIVEERNND